MDKTGTLTEGRPRLVSLVVIAEAGIDDRLVLRLAASLERGSEHPLAAAIVSGAEERGVDLTEARSFESITGPGVKGEVDGHTVSLGSQTHVQDGNEPCVDLGKLREQAKVLRAQGKTVMFVRVDGRTAGLIGVADSIKPTTVEAIRQLHSEGLRIVMLTGDNETTARAVASRLGIDEVIAEVLPNRKAEIVKRFQAEGRKVAMAGDGINDAPALAQVRGWHRDGDGH